MILLTLCALAAPIYSEVLYIAKVSRCVGDIETMKDEIFQHLLVRGSLPRSLAEIGRGDLRDPWGSPYQYLNFDDVRGRGVGPMRRDRFLVPVNSRFDLYSMGRDGRSRPPFTARDSWDDIVMANDGGYIGLASQY
jgi:general secretion pathway protein G